MDGRWPANLSVNTCAMKPVRRTAAVGKAAELVARLLPPLDQGCNKPRLQQCSAHEPLAVTARDHTQQAHKGRRRRSGGGRLPDPSAGLAW